MEDLQGKIREKTAQKLAELEGFTWEWVVENQFEDEWRGKANQLLQCLQSQGVVIKMGRELPRVHIGSFLSTKGGDKKLEGFYLGIKRMTDEGYVAAGPLVEEEDANN